MTAWTQDDLGISYQLNPRITETNVYDAAGNRRRKVIEYNASWGLPNIIRDFAANGPEIKNTVIDYNLSQAYLDRYIIGLPSAVQSSDTVNLETKTTYTYDEPANIEALPAAAIQHDQSYGALFTTRGNVTTISRWDATDKDNPAKLLATGIKYNTTGSVIRGTDPSGHQNNISYADSFSDGNNSRNTFAYPSTATDADGFSSFVQYNFDHGATTRFQRPPPANQAQGIIQTLLYDAAGRLDKVTTTNNGAYTRYVYWSNYVMSFSTVNSIPDDSYAIQTFDGFGRVVGTAGFHPGSAGAFKAQNTIYDLMGRAVKQSNPTEINVDWVPAGDDAAGWYYTQQTYDWNGRPLRTTHPDTTFREASYGGCGCAGSAVVTLTDEGTIDVGGAKRRQQKIYSDVLGRTVKTEVLNWQGGTVYSATVNTYNARDQLTIVRQFQGVAPADPSDPSCPSATCQKSTMTYDGHGRLKTKHVPQQDAAKATTYNYNSDDTVSSVVDARGANCAYGYNSRYQVISVAHTLSGYSPINISYAYDAAGNRTSMSHSVNNVAQDSATYVYDQLSRLTSETRHLNALESYSSQGNYNISYGYTLSGQLQSVTDPFSSTTNYSYDSAGRTSSVTGAYGGTNYNYATALQYRAWGAVKAASFGNNSSETIAYNSRLQPTQFRLTGSRQMRDDYSYFDDGRLKQLTDLDDIGGQPSQVQFHYMTRAYSYNHTGKISGVAGVPNSWALPPPFSGSYSYDAFNNLTSRSGKYALNSNQSDSATYTNNRRGGWTYDADGRVIGSSDSGTSSTRTWTYNAAGAQVSVAETGSGTATNTLAYDGDGQLLYESVVTGAGTTSDYLIRSTVLGAVLTKLDGAGNKDTTYVPTKGLVMPLQQKDYQGNPTMRWVHRDASGLQEDGKAYDPFGNLIHNVQPPTSGPPPNMPFYGATYGGASWSSFSNANNFSSGCNYQGAPMDCNSAMIATMGIGFASNLPGSYLDSAYAESVYTGNVYAVWNRLKWPSSARAYWGWPTKSGKALSGGAAGKATGGLEVASDGGLVDTSESTGDPEDDGDVDLENSVVTIRASFSELLLIRLIPQQPIPPQIKLMDDFHALNFMRGYNVALKKLDDQDCLRAISMLAGDLSYSAKSALKRIFDGFGFRYNPNEKNIATTTRGGKGYSRVSLSDRFFEGRVGSSNRNTDDLDYGDSLSFVILHELVHGLGKDHGDYDTPEGRKEHDRWNDEIYDNCFTKKF